ncbi:hypothetical protein HHI36_010307, partial [Cryptolaemus montrouzieri]
AAQKLNLSSSPHRRKRYNSEDEATGFCGVLQRNPPPVPPALLRRLGVKEVTGVGKHSPNSVAMSSEPLIASSFVRFLSITPASGSERRIDSTHASGEVTSETPNQVQLSQPPPSETGVVFRTLRFELGSRNKEKVWEPYLIQNFTANSVRISSKLINNSL